MRARRHLTQAVLFGVLAGAMLAACERKEPADTQGPIEPDWQLGAPDGGNAADEGTPPPGDAEAGKFSPDAKWETYQALKEDLAASRHAADGGGRAWLVSPSPDGSARPSVRAGEHGRFTIVYEAGAHGIAVGGALFLQPSPFWGWSAPQTRVPEAPGYTTARTAAEGVTLRPDDGPQLVAFHVEGRALRAGERIEIVYGDGPAGARADSYAEEESPIWLAVDGDGDGVRVIVRDSPTVDVLAQAPARLMLLGPSTAAPGDPVRLSISVLDAVGNAGVPFDGVVALSAPAGLEFPSLVDFRPELEGTQVVEGRAVVPGVYRFRATTDTGLADDSRHEAAN